MSLRKQIAFVVDAARNAFMDDPDTTEECADALRLFLTFGHDRTKGRYEDRQRTQTYYLDIVRFVREWQPHDSRVP